MPVMLLAANATSGGSKEQFCRFFLKTGIDFEPNCVGIAVLCWHHVVKPLAVKSYTFWF